MLIFYELNYIVFNSLYNQILRIFKNKTIMVFISFTFFIFIYVPNK